MILAVSFALFMDYLIYGAVLPLLAYAPGSAVGEEHLGLLATAYAVGALGATPLFGWLGERRGCRGPMIQGVLLSAFAVLLFAVAPGFTVLMVARFVQGVAGAAVWIAGLALVAEHYSGRRVEMMGYAMVGSTVGAILGPLLGSWLYKAGGYLTPFVALMALIALEATLCIAVLPGGGGSGSSKGLLRILLDRSVAVPALAVMLAAAGWGILEPLLPAHLARLGDTGAGDIGMLFAAATIVYAASAPFVSWLCERVGITWTIAIGMTGMGLTLPLLSAFDSFWFILAALCLVGVFFALLINPTAAELGEAVERRGLSCYPAVYSVYNVAYSVGMVGTSSVAASVAARIGFFHTLLIVGICMLACVLPLLAATRPRRAGVDRPTAVG